MNFYTNIILMVFLSLLLCACATTTKIEYQGKKATVVDCSGAMLDISVCDKKAKELCPKGYTVLSREIPYKNPFPLFTHLGIGVELAHIVSKDKYKKGMTIRCKQM